jgi:SAM-dependent methyltransferase
MSIKPISDKNYIQTREVQKFLLFAKAHKADWKNLRILDYGCNNGMFLHDCRDIINPKNYLGIDVLSNAIEDAKKLYPGYQFKYYNKYHPSYNPEGLKEISYNTILKDEKFDVIIAYSVFNSFHIDDAVREIKNLQQFLTPNGCILVSVYDLEDFKAKLKLHNIFFKTERLYKEAYYIVDWKYVYSHNLPKSMDKIFSFYNIKKFCSKFNNAGVVLNRERTNWSSNTTQIIIKIM